MSTPQYHNLTWLQSFKLHMYKEWLILKQNWPILILAIPFNIVHAAAHNLAYYLHVPSEPLYDLGFALTPGLPKELQIVSEVAFFIFLFISIGFIVSPLFLHNKRSFSIVADNFDHENAEDIYVGGDTGYNVMTFLSKALSFSKVSDLSTSFSSLSRRFSQYSFDSGISLDNDVIADSRGTEMVDLYPNNDNNNNNNTRNNSNSNLPYPPPSTLPLYYTPQQSTPVLYSQNTPDVIIINNNNNNNIFQTKLNIASQQKRRTNHQKYNNLHKQQHIGPYPPPNPPPMGNYNQFGTGDDVLSELDDFDGAIDDDNSSQFVIDDNISTGSNGNNNHINGYIMNDNTNNNSNNYTSNNHNNMNNHSINSLESYATLVSNGIDEANNVYNNSNNNSNGRSSPNGSFGINEQHQQQQRSDLINNNHNTTTTTTTTITSPIHVTSPSSYKPMSGNTSSLLAQNSAAVAGAQLGATKTSLKNNKNSPNFDQNNITINSNNNNDNSTIQSSSSSYVATKTVQWNESLTGLKPPLYVFQILTRMVACLCLAQSLRTMCFLMTALPGPNYHCRPFAEFYSPPVTWGEIMVRNDVFFSCGDLVFSSHTTFMVIFALIYTKYGSSNKLKYTVWTFIITFCLLVMSARKHYTVDVFMACYTVPLIWAVFDIYCPDELPVELARLELERVKHLIQHQ